MRCQKKPNCCSFSCKKHKPGSSSYDEPSCFLRLWYAYLWFLSCCLLGNYWKERNRNFTMCMMRLKYYLHKIDINGYDVWREDWGWRVRYLSSILFTSMLFICYIVTPSFTGVEKKGKFTLFIVSKLFQEKIHIWKRLMSV